MGQPAVLSIVIQISNFTEELVLNTFEPNCILYAKTCAGNIRSSCLKYAHTNSFGCVGISLLYFGS